eukprot:1838089-Rhodomonas_salina.2
MRCPVLDARGTTVGYAATLWLRACGTEVGSERRTGRCLYWSIVLSGTGVAVSIVLSGMEDGSYEVFASLPQGAVGGIEGKRVKVRIMLPGKHALDPRP